MVSGKAASAPARRRPDPGRRICPMGQTGRVRQALSVDQTGILICR
jgi:hypothetical protein